MTRASRSPHVETALSCALVMLPLALFLGILRTSLLAIQSDHPARYLIYTVIGNAGIALLPGVVFFPVLVVAYALLGRARRADPAAFGACAALLAVFPGFWVLTTPIGYWEPFFASPVSLVKQIGLWGGLLAAVAWVLRRSIASSGFRLLVRRSVALTALLLAVVGGLWLAPRIAAHGGATRLDLAPSARNRPNIFLVLVDTLRPDHLSSYGYDLPTSSNMDSFAREAVLYSRAFSQAPWTRPSCASLLTSRYPLEIGTNGLSDALPRDVPILPQFLQVEGYVSAGIVSSVQVGPAFGFDKGFAILDIGNTKFTWAGLTMPLSRLGLVERSGTYPRYNAEQLTDRAIRWIERVRGADKPLFMYLHYADPHAPYRPPAGQNRWLEFARGEGRSIPEPRDTPPLGIAEVPAAEAVSLVAHYDAEIVYFDAHFGEFIRYLKESGLYDSSLIVLTADHGEEFGEHGGWEHGHSLYNELLHVPLLIKYPKGTGPTSGTRIDRMAGLVDLLPTVKHLLGAAWDTPGWRGVSLLGAEGDKPVYAVNDSPALRALYSRRGKLIQTLGPGNEVLEEKYFSLDADFGERATPAVPAPEDSAEIAGMRRLIAEIETGAVPSTRVEIPPETREELEALGYVE